MRFLSVLLFVSMCLLQSRKNDSAPKLNEIKSVFIDYFIPKKDIWHSSKYLFEHDKKEYMPFVVKSIKTMRLIDINNNSIDYEIPLNEVDSVISLNDYSPVIYVHNLDSIFVLPDESKVILLINRFGHLLNIWNYNKMLNYEFVLSGFPTSPLFFNANKLHVRLVPKIDPVFEKRNYFNKSPELIQKTNSNESEMVLGGGWPENYFTDNYYDDYPSRCINTNNGNMVYSYAAEHELYVYNEGELIEKKLANSNFIDKVPLFIDDSIGNVSYTMKYLTITPHYGNIYFDKYRNLYYRIVFHETQYENEDGETIKEPLDQPWSIIVLDGNFNKLFEEKMDESKFSYILFVSRDGLLIPNRTLQKGNNTYSKTFSLFEVIKK